MLQNASLLAIVAVDTAENEPSKVCRPRTRVPAQALGNRISQGDRSPGSGSLRRSGAIFGADRLPSHQLPLSVLPSPTLDGSFSAVWTAMDSEKRRIFLHFSRSTRSAFFCTAPNSEISSILSNFLRLCVANPVNLIFTIF